MEFDSGIGQLSLGKKHPKFTNALIIFLQVKIFDER